MKKTTQLLLLAVLLAAEAPAQTDSLFRDGQWWYTFDEPTAATRHFRPKSATFFSRVDSISSFYEVNVPYAIRHDPDCVKNNGCNGTMLLNGKPYKWQMFTFIATLQFYGSGGITAGNHIVTAKNQKIFIDGIQRGCYK